MNDEAMRHRRPVHRLRHFVRSRLRRRLFAWFGVSILMTGVVVGASLMLIGPGRGYWQRQVDGARQFIGWEFARSWEKPIERDALARRAARDFDVDLVLEDEARRTIAVYGSQCRRGDFSVPVERDGRLLGYVRVCGGRGPHGGHRAWSGVLLVIGAGFVSLWAASGFIARRLVRPLDELVRVTDAIGEGKLTTRARIDTRAGEIGLVGEAVNRMAERIERQIADQRELLAAVSHEIRSPLARMRVLLELARSADSASPNAREKLDEIERELVEIDGLVGELLASSRLDFAALEARPLDIRDLAARAVERSGLDAALLVFETDDTTLEADPTLLSRALTNLLDNARRHAGGVTRLVVRGDATHVELWVEDAGPGFSPGELSHVFDSFVRGERGRRAEGLSLGLGLALVRRIAVAHGGDAMAENLSGGGARVGLRVRRVRE